MKIKEDYSDVEFKNNEKLKNYFKNLFVYESPNVYLC